MHAYSVISHDIIGNLSSVVPSGRLEFDQPCLNVWQKQQKLAKILFEITFLRVKLPIYSWKPLQYNI